jgi:hypothetical protein
MGQGNPEMSFAQFRRELMLASGLLRQPGMPVASAAPEPRWPPGAPRSVGTFRAVATAQPAVPWGPDKWPPLGRRRLIG